MWLQEATGHLHTIAADTPFHVQGGSDAPIQVVGILEAAGLNFDHLWVIGLSDDVWPEPAMPNPLLPITLQRRLGLPHASPQRELEYATTITGRVLSAAEEVIVSHANTDGKSELRYYPDQPRLQRTGCLSKAGARAPAPGARTGFRPAVSTTTP